MLGYGSPGLCVSSTAFLQPEAVNFIVLSEVSQSPLSGSALMGGRGGWVKVGSCVCSSVLSNGFGHNEYRPLRLRSCFCPFVICEVRILLPGGPQEDEGRVVGGFLHLGLLLSGDGGLWDVATLCTTSLPLTLRLTSMYTSYPGLIAASAPPVCPEVLSPDPLLLSHLLRLQ